MLFMMFFWNINMVGIPWGHVSWDSIRTAIKEGDFILPKSRLISFSSIKEKRFSSFNRDIRLFSFSNKEDTVFPYLVFFFLLSAIKRWKSFFLCRNFFFLWGIKVGAYFSIENEEVFLHWCLHNETCSQRLWLNPPNIYNIIHYILYMCVSIGVFMQVCINICRVDETDGLAQPEWLCVRIWIYVCTHMNICLSVYIACLSVFLYASVTFLADEEVS